MPTRARAQQRWIRLTDWWSGAWRWTLLAVGTVLGAYFILNRGVQNGVLLAVVMGLLVIGVVLTFYQPMAIALMAMPALFVAERVGLGAGDLSASDVALAAAFGTAVLLGQRPYSRPLRMMLWLNLIYQFATLFTVIINPFTANTVEWFHAWMLVSGALIVGWAVSRAGYARVALNLMLASGVAIAVGTFVTAVFQYAHGDFSGVYPLYPLPMHKNFAGTAMAFMAITVFINPDWIGWTRRVRGLAFWTLLIAIIMTQSRQAIIGLIVAILFGIIRRGVRGRSRYALLLLVPLVWLIVSTISDQVQSQNRFNSFFQRVNWFHEVWGFWKLSPIFGHGLRYWYTNSGSFFQPPQAELEVLATTGVVGLLGFAIMWLGFFIVLWRIDPRFGTLAIAVIGSRLLQAQFDLFWVAGSVSIPFVIAGICLGTQALEVERHRSSSFGTAVGHPERLVDAATSRKS